MWYNQLKKLTENFNGNIIVNTTKQTNAAFYFYDAESLEFEANK